MSEKAKDIRDKIEVVVNGKQRGNDLNILSYDHEWEYAVFGDNGIPENLRCVHGSPTQTRSACSVCLTMSYYRRRQISCLLSS